MKNKSIKLGVLVALITSSQPVAMQAVNLIDLPFLATDMPLFAKVVSVAGSLMMVYKTLEASDTAIELKKACKDGNYERAKKLVLSGNCNVNPAYSLHSKTPLEFACLSKNIKLVDLLINHGAEVNKIEYDQETPLHTSSALGDYDLVKLLLSRGANPALRDIILKEKPSLCALRKGFTEVARLLDAFEAGLDEYRNNPLGFTGTYFTKFVNPGKFLLQESLDSVMFFSYYYYRSHETDDFEKIADHYAQNNQKDAFNHLVKTCNLDRDSSVLRRKKLFEIQKNSIS